MTRSPWQSRGVLVWVVLCAAVLPGCGKDVKPVDSTGGPGATSDETTVPPSAPVTAHDSLVYEADSLYNYGDARDSIMVTDTAFSGPTVDDGTIPHMTIATATLKSGKPQPAHRIIARIWSAAAYAPMGIRAGFNYVQRSSWSPADTASWVTRIVPRDSATARNLVRDPRRQQYAHDMTPGVPRLIILKVHSIALVFCFDDPGCSSGHCGYY